MLRSIAQTASTLVIQMEQKKKTPKTRFELSMLSVLAAADKDDFDETKEFNVRHEFAMNR